MNEQCDNAKPMGTSTNSLSTLFTHVLSVYHFVKIGCAFTESCLITVFRVSDKNQKEKLEHILNAIFQSNY